MTVGAIEGHRIWSASYDSDPNPLLALEARLLADRLGPLAGKRFLDVAAGTGRWMRYAASCRALVTGIDLCPEMLARAAAKPALAGHLAVADIRSLPFRDGAFDLAVCSFALAYVPSVDTALCEMARVAARVIVSDLHPQAENSGWSRGFRAGGQRYELEHYRHSDGDRERAARAAGLVASWRVEAVFDQQERPMFVRAGKEALFTTVTRTPAVLITEWRRS